MHIKKRMELCRICEPKNLAACTSEPWYKYIVKQGTTTNERKSKMDGVDMYYKLLDVLGAETLLEDLFYSMSVDELEDKMNYIARMREVDVDEDEE